MISVVMSVYNESMDFLKESIQSILCQTEKRFEFIIVLDNPENELALQTINMYKEKDNRIVVLKNKKNIGLARSLNEAVKLAKYNIIARMDADDISLKDRLQKELAIINSGYDLVFSKYVCIDEKGDFLKESMNYSESEKMLKKSISIKNIICHPTVMFKKEHFEQVNGYSNLPVVEDFDLWRKMLKLDLKIKATNEILLKYRIRSSSMTTSNYFKSFIAWRYIKKKYSINYFNKKDRGFNELYKRKAGKKSENEKKYNRWISKYYLLKDSWGNQGITKFFKLIWILLNEYRILILLFDSARANYYRQRGR